MLAQGSDGCLCVPKVVDVMVRRTDAGRELLYLPQATEEDHGAHSTDTRRIAALTFAAVVTPFVSAIPAKA
jgi:hypothetical protein